MERFPHTYDNKFINERSAAEALDIRKLEEMKRVVSEALRMQADMTTEEDIRAAEGVYGEFELNDVIAAINSSDEIMWRGSPLMYYMLAKRIEDKRSRFDDE
jgi:hypothetical protein